MKAPSIHIPSGNVPAPPNTVPHLALASIFSKLAALHQHAAQVQANSPDKAVARLPRPDQAAMDAQKGRPLVRQPVIGTANPAAGPYS